MRICYSAADHTRAVGDYLCLLYHAGLLDLFGPSDLSDLYDFSDLLYPEIACLLGVALDSYAYVTKQVTAHVYHRLLGCSFDLTEVPGDLAVGAGLVLMHIASVAEGQKAAVPE